MKKLTTVALSIALALTATASNAGTADSATAQTAAVASQSRLSSGITLANMDSSVAPQQDFFRYVNGNWLDSTEIPADKARWGSFDELRENAEKQVLAIVQQLASQQHAKGSEGQKIADLYQSFLDEELAEVLGLNPLRGELAAIENLKSHADLTTLWGNWQRYRIGTPVAVYVGQDQKQSDQYITGGSQAGLGLPDRDYYLKDDARSIELLQKYQAFIAQLWTLAGFDNAQQVAADIVALEKQLAGAQWSRVQNRDRNATYNKLSVTELSQLAPGFNWQAFLTAANLGDINELVVRQPTYFTAFAKLQANTPVKQWQQYLKFHLLRSNANNLSKAFVDASFDFYGKTLNGLQEQRSREKRAVSLVDNNLGFMVGKKYVEQYFKPEAKARMDQMIENLRAAFRQSIDELEWMSPVTKKQAQIKLAKFNTKIGYPDKWRDYSCVEINAADLVGNLRRSAECEYQRSINRLGKPVDRTEWGMTPQTVNAYYSSTMNEIVFPAAILQPPFFNVDADDAVNYGAIGGVIGHEFTHGFDDQGRRSDGDGNLRDWWTEQDAAQFQQRAQLMVDQYSAFNPIDDLHLQGALGLGENIADLGGLTVSYKAYQNSLQGQSGAVIDGFTPEQRFFMGWSQVWRIKFRDEALRQQVITGPHSPGMYRVLGTLSNMPQFYQAYDVKPGDGMYREEKVRVKIW
ncbi:MAG: M13 family metallopeptidase [Gammaproteobacteria bacterium]|nr:M13 family metallopeptidase [Gammaproteobacteria bacterium]MBU1553879.1 M13 family metallopeptidase [Gammaproteobacteria bacterium]MBU2069461.1 M13 family metallopeptidase [Gammaproteobacteria bacterium]MBU2182965.1 M13 family metallopeptidase [Gammaproteobacteria bacterium]MBU2205878.1 M13 family metallopeptidase [Gammaproteobacteria bacterium]